MKRKSDPAADRDPVIDPDHDPKRKPRHFDPAPVRYRYDGWTPERQLAFIEALADSGCVDTAARGVGMSRNSAYALRRRADAQGFRLAWNAAMDTSIACLADSAMARAIHGVPVPIFYKGEQVGERRHFNERLTMFLLRYRAPEDYGKWMDRRVIHFPADGAAQNLAFRIGRMLRAAWRATDAALRGEPAPPPEAEETPSSEESLPPEFATWLDEDNSADATKKPARKHRGRV